MSSYKNFSQAVQLKHKIDRGEIDAPVTSETEEMMDSFDRNLDKWIYFSSWSRWYPDLFLDLIHPDSGGIVLDLDQRVFLRSILRFVAVYGVYPRAYGKCQSLDSYVYSSKGMLQLSDFISDSEEYHATGFDTINKSGEREHTYLGVYNGYKPTLKINTKYGYNNECTYNHKLMVMDESGVQKWKRADEIKVGDYLCVNRKNDIWGNETDISYAREQAHEINQKLSSNRRGAEYDFPTKIDSDMAYLIGSLIGDGGMSIRTHFTFSSKDQESIDFFINYMKDVCKYNKPITRQNNCDYTIYSTYLRSCFKAIGIDEVTSHYKKIPKVICMAPKECCRAFLQGLYDTDGGTENGNCICLATVSEELSKQVQLMLLNFGIISRRFYYERGRFFHYRVTISGYDIRLFHERIGFRLGRKQKQLDDMVSRPTKNVRAYSDYIPRENGEKIFYHNVRKTPLEDDAPEELHELVDLNYFYSPVVSIEQSACETGDINMPDTNSWICNGVVSHNTLIEVLSLFLICMFYPNTEVAMTAQTQQNAAKMLRDKYTEIIRFWPILADEIKGRPQFGKDTAEIRFANGSIFNVLANNQNSKGQRRKRINIEESALLDAFTFDDALKPIVDFPRYTVGKYAIANPEEISSRINFFTTSGRLPLCVVICIENLMNAQRAGGYICTC